jgi:hypothetical protein
VSRWSGTGSLQEVRTRSETLLYNEGSKRVIRYKPGDEDRMNYDSPPFLPPAPPAAHALPAAVGDPRTLPERARQADSGVSALDDGSIDGAPVRRFAVDGCRTRPPEGSAASRSVVSVSAGTGAPVRVEDQPCGAGGPGPATPQGPFAMKRTIDFRSFEVLPATPENLEQLELDVPPGTRTVDGVDIDLAEERDVG